MAVVKKARLEISKMMQKFNFLMEVIGNDKWQYAVRKNFHRCEVIMKEAQRFVMSPVAGQDEFDKDRTALCEKLCDRDKYGKPVFEINNGRSNYKISAPESFNAEIELLKAAHPEYEAALKAKQAEIDKYMAAHIEIDLHTLTRENLPDLAPKDMDGLEEMILN